MKSSLIVIDEFGKGTSELDGKALLASVIGHFINRDEYVPNLIISTHFLDIPKLIAKSNIVNYYVSACTKFCLKNFKMGSFHKF